MARPRTHPNELRSQTARCRMTVAEYEEFRTNAARAGLSESEFMRRRLSDVPLPPALSGPSPEYIAALNNYAVVLSRIGNNVNQLTAAIHQGRDFGQYWHEIGDELQAVLGAAKAALNLAVEDRD